MHARSLKRVVHALGAGGALTALLSCAGQSAAPVAASSPAPPALAAAAPANAPDISARPTTRAGAPAPCQVDDTEDDGAWSTSVDDAIDAALPRLAACAPLPEGAEPIVVAFHLDFDRAGAPVQQAAERGTGDACTLLSCALHELSTLKAPPTAAASSGFHEVALRFGAEGVRRVDVRTRELPALDAVCREPIHAGVTQAFLAAGVRSQELAIAECERAARERNGALYGEVALAFTVRDDGRVSGARAERDSVHDCELVSCLVESYRQMVFPPPDSGAAHVVMALQYRP